MSPFVDGMFCAGGIFAMGIVAGGMLAVWLMRNDCEGEDPHDGNPFVDPDPVPGITATIDDEWAKINGSL